MLVIDSARLSTAETFLNPGDVKGTHLESEVDEVPDTTVGRE